MNKLDALLMEREQSDDELMSSNPCALLTVLPQRQENPESSANCSLLARSNKGLNEGE